MVGRMVYEELERRKDLIDKKEDDRHNGHHSVFDNQLTNQLLNLQQHQLIKSIDETT